MTKEKTPLECFIRDLEEAQAKDREEFNKYKAPLCLLLPLAKDVQRCVERLDAIEKEDDLDRGYD